MNAITSSQNSLVKELKTLKMRKHRESKKLFFIEGLRFVEEAVKGNHGIERIFVSEQFLKSKNHSTSLLMEEIMLHGHEIVLLSDKLFKEVSDTSNPQGIIAVVRMNRRTLGEIIVQNNLLVVLESVQDPGNIGTIIRTADAAGFTGVIVSKGCVDMYNPKVLRSTMGSVFHIPIVFSDNLVDSISFIKSRGVKVFAAHLKGTKSFFEVDMRSNLAVIIGNEAGGITDEVAVCADSLVSIPMPGKSESLNASIAAGLLMYESVRQRIHNRDVSGIRED